MEKEVKTKLKSAKQISKEKLQELKDKNVEVSSSVSSTHSSYGQTLQSEEQIEDADVFVPDCQTDSEPSDLSQDVQVAILEEHLERSRFRRMLLWVVEHTCADAELTLLHLQYGVVHATLTTTPECIVVCKLTKTYRYVSQCRIHLHHGITTRK